MSNTSPLNPLREPEESISSNTYDIGPILGFFIDLIVPLIGLSVLAGFAVLLWTLVAFAQNGDASGADCPSRETQNGFVGNPEFYGLGIRLGVYFQWWASLLANLFLPNEWASMLAAYLVFSIALIVAVLVITFERTCAFTAEIIVILFIYWGGYTGLVYSSKIGLAAMNSELQEVKRGLSYAIAAPTWISIAFSTWFWLRLTTAGEVDFMPTPGGTSYFIFGRISADTKAASGFVVFICFFFGYSVVSWTIGFSGGWLWASIRNRFCMRPQSDETSLATSNSQDATNEEEEKEPPNSSAKWVMGFLSVLILIYSTIATELTLVWNSVSGVYTIGSTGQIIPLVAGLCLFINAIWKMVEQKYLEREIYTEPSELEDGIPPMVSFQRSDSTWR